MFAKLRQRRHTLRGPEFCDSCGQVCTTECRARAHIERNRVEVLYRAGVLR
jgi:hypothetical protein